ncbi:MAG: hypothetical protein WCP93_02865 [Candidatus Berkelbacteria bacterium]
MAKVHHDGPRGNSANSADHFKELVIGVKPIEIRLNKAGQFHFEFFGTKAGEEVIILESGLNCGYHGTGPSYSFDILRMLGVPADLAQMVYENDNLLYNFRVPNKPTVTTS